MSTPDFTPHADELLGKNARYAADFPHAGLPGPPSRNVAVVTCMDCRLDPLEMLGLNVGEAHVIRNGGGVLTADVVRSLTLSQRALGTREVMVVHHTKCGLEGLDNEGLLAQLEQETGARPEWEPGGFADAADDVRRAVQGLRDSPFLPHTDHIRGFVYDIDTGRISEV